MTKLVGAALSAAVMVLGIFASATPATAELVAARQQPQSAATDLSAHRRAHHLRHYAYRPYPTYYGRPVTYAPAPFVPIPPLWGYGWEWW